MSPTERIVQNLRCPSCGHRYHRSDLRLIGVGQNDLDLYMRCGACSFDVQLTIAQEMPPTVPATVARNDQAEDTPARPITADDVADMRQFLTSYQGDIVRLFSCG